MAFDFCFDKKLFLDTTCRCCSRFFSENVKFYKIYQEKLKSPNDAEGDSGGGGDIKVYEPNEEIKDVFEDLVIWKLNVCIYFHAYVHFTGCSVPHLPRTFVHPPPYIDP